MDSKPQQHNILPSPENSSAAPTSTPSIELWFTRCSANAPEHAERRCEQWLAPDEINRANQFRRPTTRNQHVVGRGMARRLLGGAAVPPESISFELAVHGKPSVVAPPEAAQPFNVAHTEGMVVCGVGEDPACLIGVDVERLQRRTDTEIARRYFAQPEVDFLLGFSDDRKRREIFLRIWTLKESYIKAIGTGLQTPLSDFAFEDIESDQPRLTILSDALADDRSWEFRVFDFDSCFVAAVAIGHTQTTASATIQVRDFSKLIAES